ncbi:MAG: glycosyltransferase family 4 protein [Solirubrobacteraceae bacterium]
MSGLEPPRLLFAARRAPYPLNNGARIRSYQLLTGLARSFRTTFITFEHHPDSADGLSTREELEALLPGIEVITAPGSGAHKRADQVLSLGHARSFTFGRYNTEEFRAMARRCVEAQHPDVVHFDDPGVALVGRLPGALNVYSSHNVEQRLLALAARVGSRPNRLFNEVERRKVAREERRIWREMDICLAVSELDRGAMIEAGARRVELCPNGVAEVPQLPRRVRKVDEPLRLLFVGSGDYGPYERGLAWLVNKVLPEVRAAVKLDFEVVGTPPVHPIAAPGVRYVGRVPELEPYYERAHVVVIPVFEGSGTRLKLIEAAAYGRPTVTTALGAEGLPLTPGRDFLQADDAGAFSAAILQLGSWWLEDRSEPLGEMVDSARRQVQPLTWSRIVSDLADLYRASLP